MIEIFLGRLGQHVRRKIITFEPRRCARHLDAKQARATAVIHRQLEGAMRG